MKIGATGYWKPCQTTLIFVTQSVLDIHKDLLDNFGFSFVFTARFSQDCCENLFSSIRSVSQKTTALTLKTAIKLISVSHYLKTSGGNYEEDCRVYVDSFLDLISIIKEKRIAEGNNDISKTEDFVEDECKGELRLIMKEILCIILSVIY